MRIFLAGATGVLGRSLLPVLVDAGHDVVAATRRADRTADLERAGARAVLCDVLDRAGTRRAVVEARPEVVVHQLTSLPQTYAELRHGTAATDAVRRTGTAHLLEAAVAAGARRVVAESIAFAYRPGPGLAVEGAPLWTDAPAPLDATVAAVRDLEHAVLDPDAGLEGVVLRYGALYGPGTWYDVAAGDLVAQVRRRRLPVVGSGRGVTSFVHVDDAARATTAALDPGVPPGAYNVVDDDPVEQRDLLPQLADLLGVPRPRRVPAWVARLAAGPVAAAVMTTQRGADNTAARAALGWSPGFGSWRSGIEAELAQRA